MTRAQRLRNEAARLDAYAARLDKQAVRLADQWSIMAAADCNERAVLHRREAARLRLIAINLDADDPML